MLRFEPASRWLVICVGLACACDGLSEPAALLEPGAGSYRLVAINGIALDNDGGTTARPLTLNSGLRVWHGSMDLRANHSLYEERWICMPNGGSCSARIYGDGAWAVSQEGSIVFAFTDSTRTGTFAGDTVTVIWPLDTLRYQHY